MKKGIITILILGVIISALSGCGIPSPTTTTGGSTNVPINKYTITGTTITPSAKNPFIDNVSIASFASPSVAVLVTMVMTAAPAATATFSEAISTSNTPAFAAYQAINNITGRNGISGFMQAASAYNSPFANEQVIRQSEADLLKQNGSFIQKTAVNGLNGLGAVPDTVGTVNNFWVNAAFDGTLAGDVQVTATCLYVGQNVYIYVDNATPNASTTYTTANLASMSAAFDAIYATDRATFGSEYKPGVDNDNRVTILISPKVNSVVTGLLGYFWGRDEYPKSANTGGITDHSNQREMFYVIDTPGGSATPLWADAATTATNAKAGYAILAHEFQHMIIYYQKAIRSNVLEDIWLNEGLSMYAMQACGYGMPQGDAGTAQWVNGYLATPEQYSLTNWTPANYGQSYLYVLYLVEHYGGGAGTPSSQLMLKWMVSNPFTGVANVESVTGAGTFKTVFRNWAMANLLDGLTTNPAYNYTSINLNGGNYGGITLTGVQPWIIPLNFSGIYPNNFGAIAQPGWSANYQLFKAGNASSALNISLTSGAAQNKLEAVLVVK